MTDGVKDALSHTLYFLFENRRVIEVSLMTKKNDCNVFRDKEMMHEEMMHVQRTCFSFGRNKFIFVGPKYS